MGIELKAGRLIRGEDGGYYKPSVSDGVLSWQPSREDMAAIDPVNIGINTDDYYTKEQTDEKILSLIEANMPDSAEEVDY